MQWIVTGNETQLYHYEPPSKHHNMEWKYTSLSRTKKFKSVPSASKAMLMLFQDFNGPILKHYQDCGQVVSSVWYCAVLEWEFKPTIHIKCKEMLTDGVVLHHDNARPHMTIGTIETI
jgi:hypothetical protein